MSVEIGVRAVERQDVVLKRRSGASKAALEPAYLRDPSFYFPRVNQQTYLDIEDFCALGGFKSKQAAYDFLRNHADSVPSFRQGRKLLVRRVDYVRHLEATSGR